MIGRLVAWFKVRYVFTDEQLMEAVEMVERADREKVNDEDVWNKAQDARAYIVRELIRRGHYDYIA